MAAETDDFPYKNKDAKMRDEISARFRAILEWRPEFEVVRYSILNAPELGDAKLRFVFGGKNDPRIMVFRASDYDKYNLITDYFIEHIRIRATRGDDDTHESVYDYWLANRDALRREWRARHSRSSRAPRGRASLLTGLRPPGANASENFFLRERIYERKLEVGTFRPLVAAGLVWFVRNVIGTTCQYVLDPCAGWGDRLIGFLASGIQGSVHVDPNPELGAEYTRMFDWARELEPELLRNYRREYFQKPFEDVPIGDLRAALTKVGCTNIEGCDLVLMAPPYFDVEIYVPNDPDGLQSITRYRTWEDWYSRFLLTCVARAASVLRPGGIFALIINQPPAARNTQDNAAHVRFLDQMTRDISGTRLQTLVREHATSVKMRYLGVISYAEHDKKEAPPRSPQPIWLWLRERI